MQTAAARTQTVTPLPRQVVAPSPRAVVLPFPIRMSVGAVRGLAHASPEAASAVAWRMFMTPKRHRWPARERPWLKSAERFVVSSPVGELVAWSWGQEHEMPWESRARRNTVVLMHGWEGRGTQLSAFVEPLVAAGLRVVALDGPAHGASPGSQASVLTFARGLRALGHQVGPLRGVVAHSMGAAAAALALADGLDADKAVLLASPSRLDDVLTRFCAALDFPDTVAAGMRRHMEKDFGVDVFERTNVDRVLTRVSAAGLLVHDVDDPDVPYSDALHNAQRWPGARLITTAGLGHRRILKDPPVIAEVAAFLGA